MKSTKHHSLFKKREIYNKILNLAQKDEYIDQGEYCKKNFDSYIIQNLSWSGTKKLSLAKVFPVKVKVKTYLMELLRELFLEKLIYQIN